MSVVCLVWQGKVWMGWVYGYGLGWMDCLDGMAWHGLGMDASMRVHAWAGLN